MDQKIVNATLIELGQARDLNTALEAIGDSVNTLRLGAVEHVAVDDLSGASTAAMQALLEARPGAREGRTSSLSQ